MSNSVIRLSSRILGLAAASAIVLSALRPAAATPSGLINLPSTDIYSKGTVHLDVDFNYAIKGSAPGAQSDESLSVGGTFGIGPDNDKAFGRTEVGLDAGVIRFAGARFSDTVAANIKTQLYNNPEQNIRVVVGGLGIGNRNTPRIGYITASKNFGDPGRVHLGVSRIFNNRFLQNRTQVQIGYEKVLSEKLLFLAEHNTGKNALGNTGVSLVYNIDDRSGLQLAYVRPNSGAIRNINRAVIYLGYDRNFGQRGEVEAPPADPAADGEAKK